VAVVGFYLAESVLWPYVNERRAILVLPLLAAWYVLGAVAVWRAASSRISGLRRPALAGPVATVLAGVLVIVPLVVQMPRDYLFNLGQSSSRLQGSPYVGMLSQLGMPSDVVETDYRSAVSLFTGHDTAWNAFQVTQQDCDSAAATAALSADRAAYLLLGDVNKPGLLDRPCLLALAQQASWAVQLMHTYHDDAWLYELVGPGTGNPGLADLLPSATYSQAATYAQATGSSPAPDRGQASATWRWPAPRSLTQVSLSTAWAGAGTDSVELQVEAGGRWSTLASSPTAVGDYPGRTPFLLATVAQGVEVQALRVVVGFTGTPGVLGLSNVHAFGPAPGG